MFLTDKEARKNLLEKIASMLEKHAANHENVECIITFNGRIDETFRSQEGMEFHSTRANETILY